MKKKVIIYSIIWSLSLILFNLVSFITPIIERDTLFWVSYITITMSFIGQYICALFVFKTKTSKKVFYRLSLYTTNYFYLGLLLLFSALCLLIKFIPNWIGIILCVGTLVCNIVTLLRSLMAIDAVEKIDTKIETKTFFIKSLIAEAQVLVSTTTKEPYKTIVNKVYESIRYSDPMSNNQLKEIEIKIETLFKSLSSYISNNDYPNAEKASKDLLALINERNAKCRINK